MNAAPRCSTRMEYWVRMPFRKPVLLGSWLPGGVRVGSGVSEVQAAFVTTPATVYRSHDDWAL